MKEITAYKSIIGGEEKLFTSKKECDAYEKSMEEFVLLEYLIEHLETDKNETLSINKKLEITVSIYYYCWDHPSRSSANTSIVDKHYLLKWYKSNINKFLEEIPIIEETLRNLKIYNRNISVSSIDYSENIIKTLEEDVIMYKKIEKYINDQNESK